MLAVSYLGILRPGAKKNWRYTDSGVLNNKIIFLLNFLVNREINK